MKYHLPDLAAGCSHYKLPGQTRTLGHGFFMVWGCVWEQINLSWQRNQLASSSLWSSHTSSYQFYFIFSHLLHLCFPSQKPHGQQRLSNASHQHSTAGSGGFTTDNTISTHSPQAGRDFQALRGAQHSAPTSLTGSVLPNLVRSSARSAHFAIINYQTPGNSQDCSFPCVLHCVSHRVCMWANIRTLPYTNNPASVYKPNTHARFWGLQAAPSSASSRNPVVFIGR